MERPLTFNEYRLLVEHSPVMVWRAGTDAKCDYFNETWLEFTGRTLKQEMGDGWAEGVHPDDLERCVAFYLEHFHRRQSFEMEYRLRRKDGVFRWIFDRGVPYTDDSGEFAGFIGSCADMDERRRAQDAQQLHTREQLELARDFEKWILAIVSHDIRDPPNSIQLAAHVLSKTSAAGPPGRNRPRWSFGPWAASSTSWAICSICRASVNVRASASIPNPRTCARCASTSSTKSGPLRPTGQSASIARPTAARRGTSSGAQTAA